MRHRFPVLLGYLLSSLMMLAVLYALLFQTRSAEIDSCHRVNVFRAAFDSRTANVNAIAVILIRARNGPDAIPRVDPDSNRREVRRLREVERNIRPIPLTDCAAEFPRPFPFG